MLALHGGAGGQAGRLARLVFRLLGQPGQVLTLPLRPFVVSLANKSSMSEVKHVDSFGGDNKIKLKDYIILGIMEVINVRF